MKFIILAVLIAFVCADKDASVVRSDSQVDVDSYHYAYETSNKINAEESGKLKNAGSDAEAIDVAGHFEWISPEGQAVKITYTADETGYHPVGDVLPVGPEAPAWLGRVLAILPKEK